MTKALPQTGGSYTATSSGALKQTKAPTKPPKAGAKPPAKKKES
ncbi:hypothetical protein [uncultured Tateyamaria sp.]|nr:hypothetical protein [uncultured Tateyamaria sp.]